MNCLEMEIALMEYWGAYTNLIIPNIYYGMGIYHECDLLVLTNSGYATEIEIKVSKQDLKKDLEKTHRHHSNKIKCLYFAIPEKLVDCIEYIPKHAGILKVSEGFVSTGIGEETEWSKIVEEIRKPTIGTNSYKFSDKERYKLARLGAMRILSLKKKIHKLRGSK